MFGGLIKLLDSFVDIAISSTKKTIMSLKIEAINYINKYDFMAYRLICTNLVGTSTAF